MSRTRFAFVIALTSCLLPAHAARAGINLVGAAPTDAAPSPEYMVMGDLNQDGRMDTVVVSPRSAEVDVYIAADTPSSVGPVQAQHVGTKPRRPALGDLNGDGRVDIAVPDQPAGSVWILLGRGDGTFLAPIKITVTDSRRPFAVAIGNFDNIGNADLAVTDDRLGKVFLLLNNNDNPPSFQQAGDIDVGSQPDDIRAVDLNRDGKLDLLTLNLGGPRTKDLTVLLWKRVIDGFPEFATPQKYTVGQNPSQMVIADFNNDGLPDIALLNRPVGLPVGMNISEVEVLLTRDDGVLVGPTAFPVPCPFPVAGATCRLQALAAGDFDGNGNIDLMVALADPRTLSLTDGMQAFGGSGDGNFLPGPVFSIKKVPVSMAAGDITGDGRIDIAVANQRTLELQVFVNASTPGDTPNGESCSLGDECLSDRCSNGVCCATQCDATANEVCNVPGREGNCVPVPPVPVPCTLPDQPECMVTQFCVDDFCCDQLCEGGHCNRPGFIGVCIPGIADGLPCSGDNLECSSNFCADNGGGDFICCREACDGGFCDDTGVCNEKLPLGESCDFPAQCLSSVCDPFDAICCNRQCDAIQEKCYTVPGPDLGRCVDINRTEPPTPTPTPTLRLTPAARGTPCRARSECSSGFCVNEVCCTVDSCPADQHCEKGTGVCVSGPLTPTPTTIPTPLPTVPSTDPCGGCDPGQRCVGGSCVFTSTSSGCSTTGEYPARGNLAVVALLPLALWATRRWQLHRAQARREAIERA